MDTTQMTSYLNTGIHTSPMITLRIIYIGIAATSFPKQFFNSAMVSIRFCSKNCTLQEVSQQNITSTYIRRTHVINIPKTRWFSEAGSSKAFNHKFPIFILRVERYIFTKLA